VLTIFAGYSRHALYGESFQYSLQATLKFIGLMWAMIYVFTPSSFPMPFDKLGPPQQPSGLNPQRSNWALPGLSADERPTLRARLRLGLRDVWVLVMAQDLGDVAVDQGEEQPGAITAVGGDLQGLGRLDGRSSGAQSLSRAWSMRRSVGYGRC
jgi:hypothetical protein